MMANENEIRDEDEGPDFPVIHSYYFRMYQHKKCLSNRTPHREGRTDYCIVCNDQYVYAFGGYNIEPINDTNFIPELWRYSIDLQSWIKLQCENCPRGVDSSAVILDEKFLLVFSNIGYLPDNDTNDNLYVCDLEPSGEVYNFKLVPTTGVKPLAQYGYGVVKDGEYLYTIGGSTDYEYHIDVHRLNLRTKVWEALFLTTSEEEEPRGRCDHTCGLFHNKIYIFGGGLVYEEVFGLKKLPVFDLDTRKWSLELTHGDTSLEAGKQYPSQTVYHSCVQKPRNNAQVYIIGGCDNYVDDLANPDTWMIDLNTMRWEKMLSLELRYGICYPSSAVTPSGKLYTYGGVFFNNNGDIERNESMFEAWIQVPSLKEMCWEAALQFVHKLPLDYLKRLSIPAEYKKRLLDLPRISDEP